MSTEATHTQQQEGARFTRDADAGAGRRHTPASILARLDRIDVWSLPFLFIGILGTGFLFTFYDIFDINVSFIQSCVALKPGCTPETALDALKLPVVLNLAGYVVGTLVLSPLADRYGRRNMLMVTMALTGIGSLYNALAPDYTHFVIARVITGFGIGADLAIVNTFIGEVAPRRSRARFTSLIFIMSAIGALLGIWLGLFLTTPAEPWPHGLPFAQAGPGFESGWRWMYALGALLALVAIALRFELPESPRWLVGQGRLDEADRVVADMETTARQARPARRAGRRGPGRRPRGPGHRALPRALLEPDLRPAHPAARHGLVRRLRHRLRLRRRLHLDPHRPRLRAAGGRPDRRRRRRSGSSAARRSPPSGATG